MGHLYHGELLNNHRVPPLPTLPSQEKSEMGRSRSSSEDFVDLSRCHGQVIFRTTNGSGSLSFWVNI
jgi:hypothetical protein